MVGIIPALIIIELPIAKELLIMPKRSYYDEIEELEINWQSTISHSPIIYEKISMEFFEGITYCIGSGGSLVLAKLWQQVHESHELGVAKVKTPYEYEFENPKADVVVLFSASGKNHDILNAFRTALKRGSRIVVFTISHQSELLRLAKTQENVACVYPSIKSAKDGFLAVNSTIVMAGLIYQVESILFGVEINTQSPVASAFRDYYHSPIANPSQYKTLQIIVSEWGAPAGLDLETRLAESSVAACFLTDPRSFGHGRFIWLDSHKNDTLVVMIYTPTSEQFMNKFSKNIPDFIPQYKIFAPYQGIWGAIYSIVATILLVGDLAKSQDIDPGKPDVPLWGRKLHGLRVNNKKVSNLVDFPALTLPFDGLVIDIDGTLVDTKARFDPVRNEIAEELNRLLTLRLPIGFATGRGWSAMEILQSTISSELWDRVTVGLYNGTYILKLLEKSLPVSHDQLPIINEVSSLVEKICEKYDIKPTIRPTQITVKGLRTNQICLLKAELNLELGQKRRYFKIVSSAHSVDIIPWWGSKLRVVETIDLSLDSQILCVGDQGQMGGNDEELLRWQPSVSVGRERPISNMCLWLGKNSNLRESAGLLALLRSIEKEDTKFYVNKEKLDY